MGRPGDEIAAGAGARCRLRASHADREQVVGTLKAAFVQGRLAKDEFDQRLSQAFAARTCAELAALTVDLPAGLTAATPAQPARAPGGRAVVRPGRVITAATALYAGVWGYVLFLFPQRGENPWTRPLIIDGTVVCLGVVIFCVAVIIASRRERRSGGEPPRRPDVGDPASRWLPPAGPEGQFPTANPGHRHAAEAARRHLPRPPWPVRGHCADGALAAGMPAASG
jgi:hypothetical protein